MVACNLSKDHVEVKPIVRSYKVVEISSVTAEELETVINEWVSQGYVLDGIQFAMRESSKRPSMAFILFTHPKKGEDE